MNWTDLPPLAMLRAFAAYAETGNVTDAGARLNVSHAAVSQQLRALEAHLGLPLFDRSGRALVLTEEGKRLAEVVQAGFASMAETVGALTGADRDRPVQVTTTPAFASAWLMPRLAQFRLDHPDIDLMLAPTPKVVAVGPGGIDLAIRYLSEDPGDAAERIVPTRMVVVGAPRLVDGLPDHAPATLARLPWLQEIGISEANRWLEKRGVAAGLTGPSVQVPGNLMLDGARDGQGLVVTARVFVEADLSAGRLRLLDEADESAAGYYLVQSRGIPRPAVKAFAQWLRKTARLT